MNDEQRKRLLIEEFRRWAIANAVPHSYGGLFRRKGWEVARVQVEPASARKAMGEWPTVALSVDRDGGGLPPGLKTWSLADIVKGCGTHVAKNGTSFRSTQSY